MGLRGLYVDFGYVRISVHDMLGYRQVDIVWRMNNKKIRKICETQSRRIML